MLLHYLLHIQCAPSLILKMMYVGLSSVLSAEPRPQRGHNFRSHDLCKHTHNNKLAQACARWWLLRATGSQCLFASFGPVSYCLRLPAVYPPPSPTDSRTRHKVLLRPIFGYGAYTPSILSWIWRYGRLNVCIRVVCVFLHPANEIFNGRMFRNMPAFRAH